MALLLFWMSNLDTKLIQKRFGIADTTLRYINGMLASKKCEERGNSGIGEIQDHLNEQFKFIK